MDRSILKSFTLVAAGLITLGLIGPSWAQQCLSPDPLVPEESGVAINQFDGNMQCAVGQFGCTIGNGGVGSCTATSLGADEEFTVNSFLDDGLANWTVTVAEDANILGIDTVINDNAPGGGSKGCLLNFSIDTTAGKTGYRKSNDQIATIRELTFCADTLREPVPIQPPEPVAEIQACELVGGGTITLAGVVITCDPEELGSDPGYNTRTIVVASDTDGDGARIPDKGFQDDDGEVAFSQFLCTCNAPEPVVLEIDGVPQCNPNLEPGDPLDETGEYAGLEACTIQQDTGTSEIVEFTNPTCVTSGGRRRCY